jgi:hypothetical protein
MEEDALIIWLVTLRNTPQHAEEAKNVLFGLLPRAVELMGTNLDLLGTICQVMESYMLLDYTRVLQVNSSFLYQLDSVLSLWNSVARSSTPPSILTGLSASTISQY